MRAVLLLLVLASFLSVSCRQIEKKDIADTSLKSKSTEEEFNRKLEYEPKLFLQFWSGMSTEEYFKVYDILVQKGVIVNGFYITNDCKVEIDKVQKNEHVVGIKLYGDISCLYPLYEEKYGIDPLIKKNAITASFIENNPDYDPKMFYNNGKAVKRLPECFDDKTERLKNSVPLKINEGIPNLKSYLPKDEIIINRDNGVIKIQQQIFKSDYIFYNYSLDESEDMKMYQNSEEGQKYFGLSSLVDKEDSPAKYIISNSKTRSWSVSETPNITITYMSKIEYENEIKIAANKESKEKQTLRNKINKKQERKKEVLNEI